MERCPHCDGELHERWEYCIHCGGVLRPAPAASADTRDGAEAQRPDVPAAIRPDPVETTRGKVDIPLIIGFVLGTAGVVLIAYMAIWLFGPR